MKTFPEPCYKLLCQPYDGVDVLLTISVKGKRLRKRFAGRKLKAAIYAAELAYDVLSISN